MTEATADSGHCIGNQKPRMKNKLLAVTIAFVFALPTLASAQMEETQKKPTMMENLIFSLLPIVLIAAIIWFFFTRVVRKSQTRTQDYIVMQQQHAQRVEQLLERIAKAVEKDNPNTPR